MSRRPIPRPAARPAARPRPAAGPAIIPPTEPKSSRHRRQLLKATYYRLGRLARVPASKLAAAETAQLWLIVEGVPLAGNARGMARRLATKVLRLRG